VARARAGHLDAFGQLARACADRLFVALPWLRGDRNETEDVAQEALLRAWREGDQPLSGRSTLFTLLYPIVVNEPNHLLQTSAGRAGSAPSAWTVSGECFHE
jgi:DNA-directed RNA polymerase specialized sigma24 family protein